MFLKRPIGKDPVGGFPFKLIDVAPDCTWYGCNSDVFTKKEVKETMFSDTIAAISTAVGEGGIAIIRVSGPDSVQEVERIFKSKTS